MTALVQRSAIEQLAAVAARLDEVRLAENLSLRDTARILGLPFGNIHGIRTRTRTSTTLPLLDAYARHLGRHLNLVLVEDDPGQRRPPWRERMPHGEDDGDAHAMTELWRLQQELHRLRQQAGLTRDEVAATLGIGALMVWRLENSPAAPDAVVTNVLMYARLFGYTAHAHLIEPLE